MLRYFPACRFAAHIGQRFLEGLTTDEAMLRYRMDNTIASKQQLGLSVGVGLSTAQEAALRPRRGDYRAGRGESPQRVYGPCRATGWPPSQPNQADTPSQGSVRARMSMRLTFSVAVRSVIMGCVG